MTARRYLACLLAAALAVLMLLVSVTWFIDPYGRYWSPVLQHINAVKPESGSRVRVVKAVRAAEVDPEVLLVGNSRAEMGLHPSHPAFAGRRVYNQAMPGASLRMQLDYALDTAARASDLRQVIMGVDFLDFLVRRQRLAVPLELSPQTSYGFRLPTRDRSWAGRMARCCSAWMPSLTASRLYFARAPR